MFKGDYVLLEREAPPDFRRKDVKWQIHNQASIPTMEGAVIAVLMDLRDEIKETNAKLHHIADVLTMADSLSRTNLKEIAHLLRGPLKIAPLPATKPVVKKRKTGKR